MEKGRATMIKSIYATSLEEALNARLNPELIPYAGGTDLMVSGDEDAKYLFLGKVPQMRNIVVQDDLLRLGAAVTFTEIINHKDTPQILKEACLEIAAPAIRNSGTIGGNIGNGSAKGDSALAFMVMDAKLLLATATSQRTLPIKEFYQGRKKLALKPDELIVEVIIPRFGLDNFYFQKVGARDALAISRLSFAGLIQLDKDVITHLATAFGAVADVIIRPDEVDQMLIGKTIAQAKELKEDYLQAMDNAIVPIRGRVSIEYRKDVAMNLLRDFLGSKGI
jgi:CO/xanthine dehydrogenase FAD-binding subunit